MSETSIVMGSVTDTPQVEGYDLIDVTIIRNGKNGESKNFQVPFDKLSKAEQKTVIDFANLVVSQKPKDRSFENSKAKKTK